MTIVVTGLGLVTPLGRGSAPIRDALVSGRTGIGPIAHFAETPFAGRLGGGLPRRRFPHPRGEAAVELGASAILDALSDAGASAPGERIAIVAGTTMASKERPLEVFADDLRRAVALPDALVLMISTACTSGADAIAFGAELLRMGAADRVLAGGTDEIDVKAFAGFHALKLLATGAATPFGQDVGTMLGEGAAFLCLERADGARDRSRPVRAAIEGWASTADAFHATSPHPSGDGLRRAIEGALRGAGLDASAIGWVSAHGTGTVANDTSESLALEHVFGPSAVPVTALKSLVGHTLGAAGAVELALCILAMDAEIVPGTAGVETLRAGSAVDLVRSPRPSRAEHVIKLSAAFAGVNSATVVARRSTALTDRSRRRVFIMGAGAVGGPSPSADPFGLFDTLDTDVDPIALEQLAPALEARGADIMSRLLTVASARAFADAGIEATATASSQTGIFVGQRAVSPTSHLEFDESALARGLARVSASAFTRKVLNAATGATSRALGLRGPTTTLSAGRGSGMVALVLAAERLATSAEADLMVCGAVHERDRAGDDPREGEGAAVVVLATRSASPRAPRAVLAGWALGGPLERAEVIRRAGGDSTGPTAVFDAATGERGGSLLAGHLAIGRALGAIDRGETACALVVEAGPLAVACVRLERAKGGES